RDVDRSCQGTVGPYKQPYDPALSRRREGREVPRACPHGGKPTPCSRASRRSLTRRISVLVLQELPVPRITHIGVAARVSGGAVGVRRGRGAPEERERALRGDPEDGHGLAAPARQVEVPEALAIGDHVDA